MKLGGRARLGAAVLVAVLGSVTLAGCGWVGAGDQKKQGSESVGTATAGPDGVQTITVTGNERMRFSPNVIKAHPGRLKITLKTTGPTPHDLTIRKFQATTGMVQQGGQGSVEVNLPAKGSYDFVCTYHEKLGMTGQIRVS